MNKVLTKQQEYYYKTRSDRIAYSKKWYDENRLRVSNVARETRIKSPEKVLLTGARTRAKRKKLEFNIDAKDVIVPELCPILGIKLEIGDKRVQESSPTIDRIDNSKGYIKGNVQVISYKANTMKSNANPEELVLFAKWIIKTYGVLDD